MKNELVLFTDGEVNIEVQISSGIGNSLVDTEANGNSL